eukprot:gnl/TRDRNA2_/TRDRNA2_167811_c0_seq3.p1 gnl/TRDRNA2_/TRDRNA2_167811_c0~~gnl/TRDRNA2_/TRDRNA2_167811_c0_seq3.p1  ORF type:complete len:502 (-),score=61.26 gnl/TRDRNA2_/TRDRNA2_167811_c0_seq3:126-1631(-)
MPRIRQRVGAPPLCVLSGSDSDSSSAHDSDVCVAEDGGPPPSDQEFKATVQGSLYPTFVLDDDCDYGQRPPPQDSAVKPRCIGDRGRSHPGASGATAGRRAAGRLLPSLQKRKRCGGRGPGVGQPGTGPPPDVCSIVPAIAASGERPHRRGLLVGQAPPGPPEALPPGYRPLQGQPEKRLLQMSGLRSPDELWALFDRIDLLGWCPGPKPRKEYHFADTGYKKHMCDGHRWPWLEARLAGSRLAHFGGLARDYAIVVLCGRYVADAFGLKARKVPWSEELGGVRYLVIPHPSGVSHYWNDPDSCTLAARVFRTALNAHLGVDTVPAAVPSAVENRNEPAERNKAKSSMESQDRSREGGREKVCEEDRQQEKHRVVLKRVRTCSTIKQSKGRKMRLKDRECADAELVLADADALRSAPERRRGRRRSRTSDAQRGRRKRAVSCGDSSRKIDEKVAVTRASLAGLQMSLQLNGMEDQCLDEFSTSRALLACLSQFAWEEQEAR